MYFVTWIKWRTTSFALLAKVIYDICSFLPRIMWGCEKYWGRKILGFCHVTLKRRILACGVTSLKKIFGILTWPHEDVFQHFGMRKSAILFPNLHTDQYIILIFNMLHHPWPWKIVWSYLWFCFGFRFLSFLTLLFLFLLLIRWRRARFLFHFFICHGYEFQNSLF